MTYSGTWLWRRILASDQSEEAGLWPEASERITPPSLLLLAVKDVLGEDVPYCKTWLLNKTLVWDQGECPRPHHGESEVEVLENLVVLALKDAERECATGLPEVLAREQNSCLTGDGDFTSSGGGTAGI